MQLRWVPTPCSAFLNPPLGGSLALTLQGWIPCRCQRGSLSYYSTKNSDWVKKSQLKQRLFTGPCTGLSLLSQGQHWTSSDAAFSPEQALNTASAAPEARHTEKEPVCLCVPAQGKGLPSTRAGPQTVGDAQPGRLLGTRSEDTCLLTRLPQGSLQNPHGTTKEFGKCSKLLRWQMRTAELIFPHSWESLGI